MQTTIQILMMVHVMITTGEAKGDLENLVNEMQIEMRITRTDMHEMNERLALTEEKLMKAGNDYEKTQEELLELKTKNIQLEERIKMAEDDQNTTTLHELERDVSFLKDPPFFHAC